MPTVDLPGMRSIRTDSACIARHRSSARPVIFVYFTPASGLNSKVVTTGPGMDLHDAAFDRELAALLLEQPRAVHQLALVDLALGLRRVEQRERRQRVLALAALGRRLGGRLGIGERQRRRRQADLRRLGRRERTCALPNIGAAPARLVVVSRRAVAAQLRRAASAPAAAPAAAVGGLDLRRGAPFFVCFAITSRRCFSRRRSSRHSPERRDARAAPPLDDRSTSAAKNRPNENCVDMMIARKISVRIDDDRAGAIQVLGQLAARATRRRSRRRGTACPRRRACRRRG